METHSTLSKSRAQLDSSDGISLDGSDEKINPTDFMNFLPWACQQLSVNCILEITKVNQIEYTDHKSTRKFKAMKKTFVSGSDKGGISSFNFSVFHTSQSDLNQIVRMAVTFSGDHLTHIKIDKTKHLPREVLAILALIIHFYPQLYAISINSGTDKYTIYEMCKILPASNITEINMDNTYIKEGYYDALLDNTNQLKVLSLARCKLDDHVIERIISKLECTLPLSKTLSVLNLSSNRLTDKGAKHIGRMLRTNRQLKYLNIASNMLTDDGVDAILNILYKFPLTVEEILMVRKNYLKYLMTKQEVIEENMIKLRKSEIEKYKKRPKKPTSGIGASGDLMLTSSIMLNLENGLYDKAAKMAELICGPFEDPLGTDTFSANGLLYSNGNNTLAYLNIAYNSISYYTVKVLLKILMHQKSLVRNPRGLVNVRLEGNPLPEDIPELTEINKILDNILSAKEKEAQLFNTLRRKSVISKNK